MNILLTNDDGWDADGLAVLASVANDAGNVWIVAPTHPMSGISHRITFDRPLQLMATGPQAYSLDGTPADCVRIAMTQLGVQFDCVLSGINDGANLGSDIYVSGTVAAAREATLRGVPAVALSQHRHQFELEYDWSATTRMATTILPKLLELQTQMRPGELINLNFPDRFHLASPIPVDLLSIHPEQPWVECDLDRHPHPTDYSCDEAGRFYYHSKYNERPRMSNCDLAICFGGQITVTKIKI